MNIPFVHQRLANGLDVIVHEDRDCPIVAVNVWYHVGSKNEQPGPHRVRAPVRTPDVRGLRAPRRRLFSAAAGNRRRPQRIDQRRSHQLLGSRADRTPLELALWMESDRMGYLLPALTEAKFENQRNVVLNERRQNYENRPYGFAGMSIVAALYPPGTSVSLDDDRRRRGSESGSPRRCAGVLSDLLPSAATRRCRSPATSTPTGHSRWRPTYFGDLDAGPGAAAGRGAARRRSPARRRLVLEDRVELPRLYLAWHSPALFAEDDAELDLVSEVLAGGKTSRLYRSLVYEQRIATEVAASQGSRELGSFFQIVATAAPGRSLAEVERAIATELARLLDERSDSRRAGTVPGAGRGAFPASPADRRRFRRQVGSAERLQRVSRDPGLFRARTWRVIALPTAPGLRRAAARWLSAGRVALSVVPARPRRPWRSKVRNRCRCPDVCQPIAPASSRPRAALRVSRDPRAGSCRTVSTPGRHSTAKCRSFRCWSLMSRRGGARSRRTVPASRRSPATSSTKAAASSTRSALHEALGRLGAQLETEVGADATLVGLTTLERSATPALTLLAEMITRPQARGRRLRPRTRLCGSTGCCSCGTCHRPSPSECSRERLYGAHPYGHLPIGTEASLRAMDARRGRGRSTSSMYARHR